MNCIQERRMGRCRISQPFLRKIDDDDLLALQETLGIILHIEDNFAYNIREIIFANPILPRSEPNSIIPLYQVVVTRDQYTTFFRLSLVESDTSIITEKEHELGII